MNKCSSYFLSGEASDCFSAGDKGKGNADVRAGISQPIASKATETHIDLAAMGIGNYLARLFILCVYIMLAPSFTSCSICFFKLQNNLFLPQRYSLMLTFPLPRLKIHISSYVTDLIAIR